MVNTKHEIKKQQNPKLHSSPFSYIAVVVFQSNKQLCILFSSTPSPIKLWLTVQDKAPAFHFKNPLITEVLSQLTCHDVWLSLLPQTGQHSSHSSVALSLTLVAPVLCWGWFPGILSDGHVPQGLLENNEPLDNFLLLQTLTPTLGFPLDKSKLTKLFWDMKNIPTPQHTWEKNSKPQSFWVRTRAKHNLHYNILQGFNIVDNINKRLKWQLPMICKMHTG